MVNVLHKDYVTTPICDKNVVDILNGSHLTHCCPLAALQHFPLPLFSQSLPVVPPFLRPWAWLKMSQAHHHLALHALAYPALSVQGGMVEDYRANVRERGGAFLGTMEAVYFASVSGPAAWKIFSGANLDKGGLPTCLPHSVHPSLHLHSSPVPPLASASARPALITPVPHSSAWRWALNQQAHGR